MYVSMYVCLFVLDFACLELYNVRIYPFVKLSIYQSF